ncbi:Uncharacterised protein [Algoriella xinjiangensis]|nr:Uncharacterised protein [Algoriella xinjiangensis]
MIQKARINVINVHFFNSKNRVEALISKGF